MDALIGETCGDNDALQERMTYQEVFNNVQLHLANQKQAYAPRTISDLQLLKQYTAQLLKKGEHHLGRVAASQLVAQSNHLENDGKTLVSVHQLNGVNRHQVSRLKRGTVLVNFVGFGDRFLFSLEEECSSVICIQQGHALSQASA
jgi:hypothetical protein